MSAMSLEELFRSSLEGVNRAFLEADAALHAEVASASDALSKISEGAIQVKLDLQTEDEDGVTYGLYLDKKKASTLRVRLGFFRVSQKGYPMLFSQSTLSFERDPAVQQIPDFQKLKAFFHDMASNPDSPLVQKVAYLMRMKQN
jgi:hypothetical protein